MKVNNVFFKFLKPSNGPLTLITIEFFTEHGFNVSPQPILLAKCVIANATFKTFLLEQKLSVSVLWHSWLISSSESNSFLGSYSCSLSSSPSRSLRCWPYLSDSLNGISEKSSKMLSYTSYLFLCWSKTLLLPKTSLHFGKQKNIVYQMFPLQRQVIWLCFPLQ